MGKFVEVVTIWGAGQMAGKLTRNSLIRMLVTFCGKPSTGIPWRGVWVTHPDQHWQRLLLSMCWQWHSRSKRERTITRSEVPLTCKVPPVPSTDSISDCVHWQKKNVYSLQSQYHRAGQKGGFGVGTMTCFLKSHPKLFFQLNKELFEPILILLIVFFSLWSGSFIYIRSLRHLQGLYLFFSIAFYFMWWLSLMVSLWVDSSFSLFYLTTCASRAFVERVSVVL